MRKQHQYIAEQLAGLNFSPHINRLSREMASENLKIYDIDFNEIDFQYRKGLQDKTSSQ